MTEFESNLTENQKHFYESKVKYKDVTLDSKEYLDFKNVLNDYLKEIQIEQFICIQKDINQILKI